MALAAMISPLLIWLLHVVPAAAEKDDSYYIAGTGNPNTDETMYWKDTENIFQDLSQFSSLYVEFHNCAWTWMQTSEEDNDIDENDYWYMGKIPPMGANVAYSLYGSLSGKSFDGCGANTFINSFYTNTGFTNFARAMSYAGLSGFASYAYDDDSYASYTATCSGGSGVGCDYSNGFAVHSYAGDECNPANYTGVTDTMSSLNSAMKSATCIQIYDSNSYSGNPYGTALELLAYSHSCFYQDFFSPDGVCPDPYGKLAYYQEQFYNGIQEAKKQDPYQVSQRKKMYTQGIRSGKILSLAGVFLAALALVILFHDCATACFSRETLGPQDDFILTKRSQDLESTSTEPDKSISSEHYATMSPESTVPRPTYTPPVSVLPTPIDVTAVVDNALSVEVTPTADVTLGPESETDPDADAAVTAKSSLQDDSNLVSSTHASDTSVKAFPQVAKDVRADLVGQESSPQALEETVSPLKEHATKTTVEEISLSPVVTSPALLVAKSRKDNNASPAAAMKVTAAVGASVFAGVAAQSTTSAIEATKKIEKFDAQSAEQPGVSLSEAASGLQGLAELAPPEDAAPILVPYPRGSTPLKLDQVTKVSASPEPVAKVELTCGAPSSFNKTNEKPLMPDSAGATISIPTSEASDVQKNGYSSMMPSSNKVAVAAATVTASQSSAPSPEKGAGLASPPMESAVATPEASIELVAEFRTTVDTAETEEPPLLHQSGSMQSLVRSDSLGSGFSAEDRVSSMDLPLAKSEDAEQTIGCGEPGHDIVSDGVRIDDPQIESGVVQRTSVSDESGADEDETEVETKPPCTGSSSEGADETPPERKGERTRSWFNFTI